MTRLEFNNKYTPKFSFHTDLGNTLDLHKEGVLVASIDYEGIVRCVNDLPSHVLTDFIEASKGHIIDLVDLRNLIKKVKVSYDKVDKTLHDEWIYKELPEIQTKMKILASNIALLTYRIKEEYNDNPRVQ